MRIVWTIAAILGAAVLALGIHIYMVTRPQASANSRGLARIDLRQTISQVDGNRIAAWLYRQKGVDHVLVNPRSATAVFTYFPARTNVGGIASALRDSLGLPHAVRYVPAAAELRRSCPMRATAATRGVYEFLKRIF